MQEQPKTFWPDKSQFAADFKDRRSGNKGKNPPLAAQERKDHRFDNSIHTPEKSDIRLGKPKASFSDAELKRQCEAQAARSAATPEMLVPAANPQATKIKLSKDVIDSVAAEIGPPWD
ncbi:MAG: hypothetical protein V4634_12920 [Pseudomonadota bacterium]